MRLRSHTYGRAPRAGFSLIEVLVGLTLLAIALTTVAKLDYNVMRRTVEVGSASYANATLLRQVNRFVSIPYDSIPAHVGCITISTGPQPNTACASTTTINSTTLQVTIISRLTGTIARPDTVILYRAKPSGTNPMNTGS